MNKTKKILICVGAVVLVLAVLLTVWYTGASYPNFASTEEFKIPGLKDGFVPQGMCRIDDAEMWLVSGYMATGELSRVYLMDKQGKIIKYITLDNIDPEKQTGHFGGIACSGKSIWVCTEGYVLYFTTDDIFYADSGDAISVRGKFDTGTKADFCFADDTKLIVGEFYKKGSFDIEGHNFTRNRDNTNNNAYALCFPIGDGSGYCGLKSAGSPSFALSLPDQTQGMCITKDGKIILSTSYGLADSKIYIYKNVLSQIPTETATINNTEGLPLYILGNTELEHTIKAPAMSEGLDCIGEKVFVLFESACSKYKLFNRTRTKSVLSFDASLYVAPAGNAD